MNQRTFMAELVMVADKHITSQYRVLVGTLSTLNQLERKFSSIAGVSPMIAWQHCIVELAIQGRIIEALEENEIADGSMMTVEYLQNLDVSSIAVEVTWREYS